MWGIFIVICLVIPAILTVLNLILLFAERKFHKKIADGADVCIFSLGIILTSILVNVCGFTQWDVQIGPGDKYLGLATYTPVSLDTLPTFFALCIFALAGYGVLRIWGNRLSPLLAALCYAGMFTGFGLTVMLTVQLWCDIKNIITIYLLLFPYNYILCAVRLMRNTVSQYAEKAAQTHYDNKLLQLCLKILSKSASFMVVSFLLIVPALLLLIIVLLLFGQQPDSVVKMFTETAEWTLSQKIPPPRLDPSGHYLCTVAARGDTKLVKPLRAGRRNHELIVVNRQLLVANAFEELLMEKTPRFHKLVRTTYDRVGLPISKYINTKGRSNAVYLIMKPLEWLFVLVLYTFDVQPENRIHRQYTGK